jgi:uncharacterized membrane protein required for colicin V production
VTVLDLVFGVALTLLVVRGWHRGLIREALDLAVLFAGVFLAFRLAGPAGAVVSGMAGTSPAVSRFVGGIVVFLAVGAGAAVAGRFLHQLTRLPGVGVMNRFGGATLAAVWGVLLATLLATVLTIVPLPGAAAAYLEESSVASALTDPDGAPQHVIGTVAGDRVVRAVLNLRRTFGDRRVVVDAEASIALPAADPGSLRHDAESSVAVFEMMNEARVAAGASPLARSSALAGVAAAHAEEMYAAGYFGHHSPQSGTVADRLAAAGIRFLVVGENLALAATPADVHDALLASPDHRETMLSPGFRRAGVAVVDGPLGLMTVQVFSG